MEVNLEIWLSAPCFLTDFVFDLLATFLEWRLKLRGLITKHLKLYYILLEMYCYQTCIYSFWWELPTIPHQLRQLSVLTASFWPWNTSVFSVPTSFQTSEAVIKEQLSLRPVMAKGETSRNILLLKHNVKCGATLKDTWMKRTEDESCFCL